MYPDTRVVTRMMFATQRKPFWRYLLKEVLLCVVIVALTLVAMTFATALTLVAGWPSWTTLAMVFVAVVLLFAFQSWRRQE
jgi:CHASE2 domain-containing sensor protein